MMAIAQSNADSSHNPSKGHLQRFYVGENLSWGSSDPYLGWYYAEKEIYENPDLEGETGHYINLTKKSTRLTGFAYSQTDDDKYGCTFSQVFDGTGRYMERVL